jgi:hypothetical protein
MWDSFFYGNSSAPRWSARWLFSTFAQMTLLLLVADVVSIPIRKYYHWDDPLKAGANGEGASLGISGRNEASIEKQKYQTRLKPSVFDAK